MKNCMYIALLLIISILLNIWQYRRMRAAQDAPSKTDTVEVVRWDTVHDILPSVKDEKIISHVTIPCKKDTVSEGNNNAQNDSIYDGGVILPIVQRTYSDDSTYTAYVSGAMIDSFPRLDSIMVRQRTVERIITNTIYKEKHGLRLKIRPAIGGGYDPLNKGWGVVAGGALVIDW